MRNKIPNISKAINWKKNTNISYHSISDQVEVTRSVSTADSPFPIAGPQNDSPTRRPPTATWAICIAFSQNCCFGNRYPDKLIHMYLFKCVYLVGGFNPFEKYQSNWIISPGKDENKKYLKPPPRYIYICIYLYTLFPVQKMCCFLGLNFVQEIFFVGPSPLFFQETPRIQIHWDSQQHSPCFDKWARPARRPWVSVTSPWNCVCPSEILRTFCWLTWYFMENTWKIQGSSLRSFIFWVVCGTSPPPSTLGKHPPPQSHRWAPNSKRSVLPVGSKSAFQINLQQLGEKKCPAPQSKHHHPKVESTRDWFWSQTMETWQDFPATHSGDNHEGLLDWWPARLHSCLRNHSEFVAGDKQMMKALVSRRKYDFKMQLEVWMNVQTDSCVHKPMHNLQFTRVYLYNFY